MTNEQTKQFVECFLCHDVKGASSPKGVFLSSSKYLRFCRPNAYDIYNQLSCVQGSIYFLYNIETWNIKFLYIFVKNCCSQAYFSKNFVLENKSETGWL